jgi:hypothetical protein
VPLWHTSSTSTRPFGVGTIAASVYISSEAPPMKSANARSSSRPFTNGITITPPVIAGVTS